MNESHFLKIHTKYKIPKKGVIHIGAHEGTEYKYYNQLQLPKVLFIEANPVVYERLQKNMKDHTEVFSYCCAISDKVGTAQFHVTSMDQSSSLLSLGCHSIDFPDIVETKQIEVPCTTLDSLIASLQIVSDEYNFLNIDIQGAELLAFKGAEKILNSSIRLINTEVNYVEMYKNCALKSEIDSFLAGFGFCCKETIDYAKGRWGDAVYVKEDHRT